MSKPNFQVTQKPWHHLEMDRVFAQLQSEAEGLSYIGARQRLRQLGRNKPPRRRKNSQIILQPFVSPLTYLLLAVSAAVEVAGGEGWVLIPIGAIHACIGIALSLWSNSTKEVASLGRLQRRQSLPSTEVAVKRDREEMDIPSRDLVVGDVVVLREGDRPSVDIRLFEAENLQANQTNIGGVAIAPKEAIDTLALNTPPLERANLIYAGTEIVSGKGLGIVVATGRYAFWQSASTREQPFSLMHRQLRQLRRIWVGCVCLAIIAIAFITWYESSNIALIATLTAAIAVGTYPQNLLRLATLAQLLGMKALAKKRLWVRFPSALDALGRLTTIAIVLEADTELSVDNLKAAGIGWRGLIRASETDANALGKVLGIPVNSYFDFPVERIRAWQEGNAGWQAEREEEKEEEEKEEEKQLEDNRTADDEDRGIETIVEIVEGEEQESIETETLRNAAREEEQPEEENKAEDEEDGEDRIVNGDRNEDLESIYLADLKEKNGTSNPSLQQATPPLKRNLKLHPQVVAVIGKDPEDIPLLRQSDVAICDRNCKKVMQDSAGLILPREDFHYIPSAILEGRAVFNRLERVVLLMSASAGTILTLAGGAIATGVAIVPNQILWMGAIATPLVAFPFILEPADSRLMGKPGATHFQSIFRWGNSFRLLLAVLTISTSVAAIFWLKYQGIAGSLSQARSMAFTTLVLSQAFHACALTRASLLRNKLLVVALAALISMQIAITEIPAIGAWMGTVPLSYTEWAIAALTATAVFWLQELTKTN